MSFGAEIILSLAAGFLSSLNPCVLPLLPVIVGGLVQQNRLAPLWMAIGLALSFAAFGWLTGFVNPLLGVEPEHLSLIASSLLILAGCLMMFPAVLESIRAKVPAITSPLQSFAARLDASGPGGAFLLGVLMALIWTPCGGAMFGAAIGLLSDEASVGKGSMLLGLYGFGASLPLLFIAYGARGSILQRKNLLRATHAYGRPLLGSFLLIFGILSFFGWLKQLESLLLKMLPDSWIALGSLL